MFRVRFGLALAPVVLLALVFTGCVAALAQQPEQLQPSATATVLPTDSLAVVRFYVPTVT